MKLFTAQVVLVLSLVSGTWSTKRLKDRIEETLNGLKTFVPSWLNNEPPYEHDPQFHRQHDIQPHHHDREHPIKEEPQSPPKVQPKISSPEECARPCREGEPPKTCYYTFTLEYYGTMNRACDLCQPSTASKVTADCQCLLTDGFERSGMIVANRMYPGPAIMVCRNDNVVIDVVNKVPGNAITIHWHGIHQRRYPYYDGVPYVTQCPILDGTTFRYQWKAENSGTHYWHAHTGIHKGDGLAGPLIVREPKRLELNNNLWDFDNTDNVIFLTDIFHASSADHFPGNRFRDKDYMPDNLLINGMGQWTDSISGNMTNTPLATFIVRPGRRYRFRLINALCQKCPVQLTIERHRLTIIASDGEPFAPFTVDSITTNPGERYDFIITTDKTPDNYWIQLRGVGQCVERKLQQFGVFRYDSALRAAPQRSSLTYDRGLPAGVVLNQLDVHCYGPEVNDRVRCIDNQKNARPIPRALLKDKPDVKLFLPFGFDTYSAQNLFQPGQYRKYITPVGASARVAGTAAPLGRASNDFPSSPLLTQRLDIPESQICSVADMETKCRGSLPCECVHVEKIPLKSVVELILVDRTQIPYLMVHSFHLHGQPFYIFGGGDGGFHNYKRINISVIQELDRQGKLNRYPMYDTLNEGDNGDPETPGRRAAMLPAKDTFTVPYNGYSIIRFFADNPGYWLLHCHVESHLLMGMAVVFQVGEPKDLPPVPRSFPRCGHYMPPLMFEN